MWPKKQELEFDCMGNPMPSNKRKKGFNEAIDLCRAANEEEVRELREIFKRILPLLHDEWDGTREYSEGNMVIKDIEQSLSRLTEPRAEG